MSARAITARARTDANLHAMAAVTSMLACIRRAAVVVAAALAVNAANAAGPDALAARYAAWKPIAAQGGPNIAIASSEAGDRMRGDIDGLLPIRFDSIAPRLETPRDWCDIALLHLNVKTCTHENKGKGDTLTFYSGSKRFEPAANAYALRYHYHVQESDADYVAVELTAPAGPLDTRDYSILVEAMPVDDQTFVHLSYAYRPSTGSRIATSAYLATAGSSKKGFSIIGRDREGHPAYVGGLRGIVERNAARNFFAIQAFCETLNAPAPQRLMRTFERWFDLTERFPAQLHELDRTDYLAIKQQEHDQQVAMQRAIDGSQRAGF
jgi:hypothetical protein